MGENTRYIHIRHSKTFPRQPYRIQNLFPFPAPFPLLALLPGVSAFRPAVPIGLEDRIHDQASDHALDHAFDRLTHFVPSPVPCLSPSPHPVISYVYLICSSILSCVRSASSRSSPRYLDKLGVAWRSVCPCQTSRLVRCCGMWRYVLWISHDGISGKQARPISP